MSALKSLWNANVPATEIARMMELMREGKQPSIQGPGITAEEGIMNTGTVFPYCTDEYSCAFYSFRLPVNICILQLATTFSLVPDHIVAPTPPQDCASSSYSIPTSPNDTTAQPSGIPALNPSAARGKMVPEKQRPIILAPPPSSPPYSPSSPATSSPPETNPEPTLSAVIQAQAKVSNVHLTDEQIDFVADLSSANVPPAEVARLMERMRSRRAASGRNVVNSDVNQDTAPPSYNDIDTMGFPSANGH
jgi:hypothetical protein